MHRFLPRNLLGQMNDVKAFLSSANGTWLDRMEAIAIGRRGGRRISSLSGHLPEIHSVMALAGIAAGLLNGRLPRLLGGASGIIGAALPDEPVRKFGVVCSDYTGLLSAAEIEVERK